MCVYVCARVSRPEKARQISQFLAGLFSKGRLQNKPELSYINATVSYILPSLLVCGSTYGKITENTDLPFCSPNHPYIIKPHVLRLHIPFEGNVACFYTDGNRTNTFQQSVFIQKVLMRCCVVCINNKYTNPDIQFAPLQCLQNNQMRSLLIYFSHYAQLVCCGTTDLTSSCLTRNPSVCVTCV